jgi:hypothetical protein
MSAEFDDVLTNQPVVIDNVGGASNNAYQPNLIRLSKGLRDY